MQTHRVAKWLPRREKADQNNFYMPRRSAEKETRHHTLLICKKQPTGLGLLKHDQQAFKNQGA